MIKIQNTIYNHCFAADDCGKYWMKQKDDYFELWQKSAAIPKK